MIQQGRQLTGAAGSWFRLRRDQVRLPVAPLRHGRRALQVDPRRDGSHLHARCQGRGEDDRLRRARDRQDGNHEGVREPRRTGRRTDAKLVSTGQPTVIGVPKDGQTLQVSAGSWSPTPTTIGYQWLRCNPNGRLCKLLPGATASTYAVTTADTGHALLAVVHATVGAASQDAVSVATPSAVIAQTTGPSSGGLPTVIGTGKQGTQLTGSTGIWSGSGVIGYGYQWYRCDAAGAHCKSVHGATKPTYTSLRRTSARRSAFARPCHRCHGDRHGVREPRRSGRRSQRHSRPDGATRRSRAWRRREDPPGLGGQLEPEARRAHVRLATLQPERPSLRPDRRCDGPATYAVTAADAGHALLAVVQAQSKGVSQPTLSVTTAVVS